MSTSLRLLIPASALVGLLATTLAQGAADSAILFVDSSAAPNGDGASWTSAHQFLTQALAAAAVPGSGVTEIRVAQGTYHPDESVASPDGTGDRSATYALVDGVTLRGGFAGVSARNPDARDPVAYPTILSGDLLEDDLPSWVNHSNNSYHVVSATNVAATTSVDGLVIRGGYSVSGGSGTGAGLNLANASLHIENCTIDQCLGSLGAGMYSHGGSPTITGCRFNGNYAWGGRGGAMYYATPTTPTITECDFTGNQAYGAGGVGDAGAVFFEFSCPATFHHCDFVNNTSSTSGSVYPTGGAITTLSDNLILNGCRFLHNTSPNGAGGAIWSASDHAKISSCEFVGNSATAGGAVVLFLAADVSFVNCTVAANSAGDGGGLFVSYSSVANITNCILWANTANAASPYKAAIHTDDTSDVNVAWTCIQSMWVPEPGEDPLDPANFPGCTDAIPLFVDGNGEDDQYGTLDDDFRLSAGSPLIDAGKNSAVPIVTTTDVAGLPRFMDDPATSDSGDGTAPIVDMGANEFGEPPVLGDLNDDYHVNGADLGLLLGAWGTGDETADLNGDGTVNGADLAMLLGAWG